MATIHLNTTSALYKGIGASLDIYSDDTKKERDDLYKQYIEVGKALPSAEELRREKAEASLKKTAMNLNDARKIWGEMMDDEQLEEWVELTNKIKTDEHDTKIPKGATIVL